MVEKTPPLVRFGLIGCGRIGNPHMRNIVRHPRSSPRGYVDTNINRAETFLATFGGDYASTSYTDVLDDTSIDAVVIASPDGLHAAMALDSISAGKHVLLEKPPAMTSAECAEVADAAKRAGVVVGVNLKFRDSPMVRRAAEWVPEPCLVTVQAMMDPFDRSGWKSDPSMSGGILYDLGPHAFNLVTSLCPGDPTLIMSMARSADDLIDPEGSFFSSLVRFDSGCVATVSVGEVGTGYPASKWSAQLFDGQRTATLNDSFTTLFMRDGGAEVSRVAARSDPISGMDLSESDMSRVLDSFVTSVLEGTEMSPGIEDGRKSMRLIEACVESARSAGPAAVPSP